MQFSKLSCELFIQDVSYNLQSSIYSTKWTEMILHLFSSCVCVVFWICDLELFYLRWRAQMFDYYVCVYVEHMSKKKMNSCVKCVQTVYSWLGLLVM